jgi:hypothetical protein
LARNLISKDVGGGFQIWSSYEWALERVVRPFGLENFLGTMNVTEKFDDKNSTWGNQKYIKICSVNVDEGINHLEELDVNFRNI